MKYRLLLNSADAVYDDSTKTYLFELQERLDRPVTIRVAKCHFANATTDVHPLVVYCRSDALSNLIKSKHTLRIKNQGHRQTENILCSLTETHTVGRYNMEKDTRVFKADPEKYIRNIDIKFTNNGDPLGSTATASAASGSDEEMDAINQSGRLLCWTDFDNSRMFNTLMQESTGVGSEINFIYDRGNAALLWQLAYGASLVVVEIGDNGAQGVYRNGSWQSVVDTSPLPQSVVLQEEFTFHIVFQQNMINDHSMLAYWSDIKICMWQGSLCYFKLSTNHVAHQVPNVTIVPTKPYLLTVKRRDNGAGGYEFHWRAERLDDESVQESVTEPSTTTIQANQVWRMGYAATNFSQYWGPTIVHNGILESDISSSQTWLRNHINGVVQNDEGAVTESASSWFLELDVETQE